MTQASREGKKNISASLDANISKALRRLALEQDRTMQQMMAEAIEDLFCKYGVSVEK